MWRGTRAGGQFLGRLGAAAGVLAAVPAAGFQRTGGPAQAPAPRTSRPAGPRGFEFVFARLRYDSGDWDYNPKVAANVLDAVVQYTEIPVYPEEIVIAAGLGRAGGVPVSVHDRPQARALQRPPSEPTWCGSSTAAACCSPTTAITTSTGSTRSRSRTKCAGCFPGRTRWRRSRARTRIYRSFFRFPDGPPQTSHELNGWGDDMVHDYLRGVERRGRLGVIYSNKDYGCEWDYDWRNKRFRAEDNTRFAVNLVVYTMT